MSAPAGFPALLLRLRADRGMTQKDLAKASGVSVPQIARYETGNSKPRMTAITKLAKALEVEPEELINANEPETVELLGYSGKNGDEFWQSFTLPKALMEAGEKEAEKLGVSFEVFLTSVISFRARQQNGEDPNFLEILVSNKRRIDELDKLKKQ